MADDDAGSRLRTHLAAALTAGAGVVHMAAAVPHFADSVLLGSGFVAAGWAQLAAAALLLRRRRDRSVRWSVVALNVVAVATWAVSRTVGLPVGHPGPEAADPGDVLTIGFEIAAVAVLMWRSRRASRRRSDRWRRAVVMGSVWTLVVGGSMFGIADVGTHGHDDGADPGHGRRAAGEPHQHVAGPSSPSMPAPTSPRERGIAEDLIPGSQPDTDRHASSNDPDHADTHDHGADHTHAHAPGEDH